MILYIINDMLEIQHKYKIDIYHIFTRIQILRNKNINTVIMLSY